MSTVSDSIGPAPPLELEEAVFEKGDDVRLAGPLARLAWLSVAALTYFWRDKPDSDLAEPGDVDPDRFCRHHPKWHDGLRGENRKWDRLARSTPRNIRTRLWSW